MASIPETLIRHAAELFAAKGFDATSIQDLVESADVTKGALYYYFESKDDLLYQIHQRFITYEFDRAERVLAQNLLPRETLRALIIDLVESIALFQPEVTVFFREMHRLSPEKFAEIKVVRDRYHAIFRTVIERGQAQGIFRSDISAEIQTLTLFGMCNWTYIWYHPSGAATPRQIGESFATLLLAGIELREVGSRIGEDTHAAV